jgi:DNA polymerase I
MLRLACCLATEQGLAVCALMHDTILIEAPKPRSTRRWRRCRRACGRRVVLGELKLGSDSQVVRWPDRYGDECGEVM